MLTYKAILGKLGENLPFNPEFKNVRNLNDLINPDTGKKMNNFRVFDIIAEKDGETYVFSAKARTKFNPSDGKLNRKYIHDLRLIEKAKKLLKKIGYDPDKIHYCFIMLPFEEEKDAVYYWGDLDLTKERNYISMTEESIATYKKYGIRTWEEVKTKYF